MKIKKSDEFFNEEDWCEGLQFLNKTDNVKRSLICRNFNII